MIKTISLILNGIWNFLLPTSKTRRMVKERKSKCDECIHKSTNLKKVGYKSNRIDVHCTLCKCNLFLKQRSEKSTCPNKLWKNGN